MGDAEKLLHDIDAHDAAIKRAELRREELSAAIHELITGIAMNEVALELARHSTDHQAEADEITAEISHGRKRIHEMLDEAIEASVNGLRPQHAQAELRAELFPIAEG